MVSTRALAPLLLATASAAELASYDVPSVDYEHLATESHALLQAMQRDGIVALKNIPQYTALREQYLAKAASCAVQAKAQGAEFLLHRQLQDGTQRYTISTESGRRLDASGFETVETCPGYQEVYHQFSRTIEEAVSSVGRALDGTKALQIARRQLLTSNQMTARELVDDSVHLDHFHAYEASRELTTTDLSLAMHTDNGLLIAMTAPEYFDVAASGHVSSHETRSEDAGLIIKTAAGETVRPVLHADELVLMLGEGINQWIHTTPQLHPVTHGMQYPRGLSYVNDDHHSLRAWFGKMILLSDNHVMLNSGMTYGEYANKTTRYLMESHADEGFAAVACPPHHRLLASDNKCTLKKCSPKAGADASALTKSCQILCNHNDASDAKVCTANCDCETSSDPATKCWMLCVADVSKSECPGEQKCNDAGNHDKTAMTCVAGDSTPAPSTTSSSPSPSPSSTTKSPAPSTTTTTAPSPSPSSASPSPSPSSTGTSSGSKTESAGSSETEPVTGSSADAASSTEGAAGSPVTTAPAPSSAVKPVTAMTLVSISAMMLMATLA
ncbi:hypothetical protein Poli38472_014030 [Pythium oligandrum]|uniref:Fe2OG dioxygenase domain-containing protein n=1 Tax=Pythium oligandrum TaxID=41045 RepID=A0A8K1FQL7_PYTOL|nr:hypothetical protein Poli38472_014030 [Pythium oligandrum]|eukprot:TMW66718.1 hypothetical protein Poli38472_014030 [Pythium oligandrum]